MKLKILPKATESVWKNPPERFEIKALDTDSSVASERLFPKELTKSLAPENASF